METRKITRKKIAFLTITLSNGGAERVISNLLLNLSSEKYEKYIILLDDQITYPYDGKLLCLKTFKNIKKNKVLKIINYILALFKLIKIKKNKNFDVCISFLDIPNFLNLLSKQKERTCVSVRTHISASYKGLKKIVYGNIIKRFYKYSDEIISVSNECKKDLENSFNIESDKIKTIYNFYDLERIEKLSDEKIDERFAYIFEKKVLITSGRLTEQKGHEYLIRMFARMENRLEYNLVILGEGDLKEELKKLAKELNVSENVYFLGFQDNPFKFLKKSYIFLFPSFAEGFPNALAEAMACGLPIISNNCKSGPKEILDNGTYGKLINNYLDKNNLDRYLYEEVQKLSQEIEYKFYKDKSLERIKKFSKENIINKWENIIDKNM